MMRLIPGVAVLAMLVLSACSTAGSSVADGKYDKSAKWAAKGTWTDSCCCSVSCPCLFGSAASLGHCEGVTLVHLQKAHYGGVNLDGVSVVAAYRSKDWVKYYVSDKATKAQTEAVVKLLPKYVGFLGLKKTEEVKNVPISVKHSGGNLKFSAGGTVVEMNVIKGKNGNPVKLHNFPFEGFPSPAFLDHTQYKSAVLKHESDGRKFEYKGTNAFTAQLATVSAGGK